MRVLQEYIQCKYDVRRVIKYYANYPLVEEYAGSIEEWLDEHDFYK